MLAEDFCKGNAPERSRPFPTTHVEVAYKHCAVLPLKMRVGRDALIAPQRNLVDCNKRRKLSVGGDARCPT